MSTYTNASFSIVLSQAVKSNNQAKAFWHEAFKQAIALGADKNRNLEPLNRLLTAVKESKNMPVMPLVKAVLVLAGGSLQQQDKASIVWNAEAIKFNARKLKEGGVEILFTEKMVTLAKASPWWEIAPQEKVVQFADFSSVTKAIKSLASKTEKGESTLTGSEKALLLKLQGLITQELGSQVWEDKRKK